MPSQRSAIIGIACMALGMVFMPISDSIAKYTSTVAPYSPAFLAWSRFAIGGIIILPITLYFGLLLGHSRKFYFQQAIRAALIASTMSLIITAVKLSPVAEVFGAFFIGPALAIVFSVWLLQEKATRLEWLSVSLGFLGVLFVLQPTGEISVGLLWALAAGVCYAGFLVATRWAANSGPPLAQLAMQLVFGFVFLLPVAASDFVAYVPQAPVPLVAMGITSAIANLMSIIALARASTAMLAPVVYLQLVSASLIGLFLFKDSIDFLATVGLITIIVTGLLKIPAAWKPSQQVKPQQHQ